MKAVILSLAAIALLATSGFFLFAQSNQDPLYTKYVAWKAKYGKNTNGDNDMYRFSMFTYNYNYIQQFNAEQTGDLRLGTNIFADLSNAEYVQMYIGGALEEDLENVNFVEQKGSDSLPESIDWVSKGAVAPVEDQGSCGSCWAFSVKESLEGIYQIKSNKLEVLSAQQLTDCSTASFGCNGGYQTSTYTYTQSNGIQTESSYPYVSGSTGRATPCTYNESDVVFKNTGSAMVSPRNNQDAVLNAVQNQPLSVLVAASGITFQLYQSGVLDSCGTRTDHAILLTGYDQSSSTPYYTCKNSWGTGWGNQGYIQLAMTGDGVGTCAVQSSVAYPTY